MVPVSVFPFFDDDLGEEDKKFPSTKMIKKLFHFFPANIC